MAFGDSFGDARRQFAEVVATAVIAGAIVLADTPPVDAIRVMALTRKTFPLAELATS